MGPEVVESASMLSHLQGESETSSQYSEDAPASRPLQQFDTDETVENAAPSGNIKRLYISHFLSTWNSRFFEFGAVLFLASIYPGTLLPASIYALTRSAAAIVLAPSVGRRIDKGDRLDVVRTSIGMYVFILSAR